MARFRFVVLASFVALLLVFGLLWLVRAGASPDPASPIIEQPQAALPPIAPAQATPTGQPTVLPAAAIAALTPLPAATAFSSPERTVIADGTATLAVTADTEPVTPEAIAIVDGVALLPVDFDQLRAIDTVMAGLVGQASSLPAAILEQWVNGELVWRRAAEAGLPAIDADRALDDFLARIGRRREQLDAALTDAQVSPATFAAYWRRLVLVQQFVQEQAAAQGVDRATYVRRLQQAARISFGPVVGALIAAPAATSGAVVTPAVPAPSVASISTGESLPIATGDVLPITRTPDVEPSPAQYGVEVGMVAPEFVLETLAQGREPSLALHDMRGLPTVLSFWTTWCPYCLRQTPVLVAAYETWAAQGMNFVGISVQEDRSTVAPYVAQHQIEYPILLDEQGDVAAAFAVQGYPTTYFLDPDHRVVARHVGVLAADQLDAYIQMLVPSIPELSEASP